MEEDGAVRDSSSPILAQSGFTLRSDSEHSGKEQRLNNRGKEGLGKGRFGHVVALALEEEDRDSGDVRC